MNTLLPPSIQHLDRARLIFSACLIFLCFAFTTGCRHAQSPAASFYFWRTTLALNETEQRALTDASARTIYVRYFDVDFTPGDSAVSPVSPLNVRQTFPGVSVVPVVYIKNRTFERISKDQIELLVAQISSLVSAISRKLGAVSKEIQFDCDWTEGTRTLYFDFLTRYKAMTHDSVSATIRLHQVKYKERTGVPPVDYGVLMYYNMGEINSGDEVSIYERSIANRYIKFLRAYPLQLEPALPIFTWGYVIHQGRVERLLNKVRVSNFQGDTNFVATSANRFQTLHPNFHAGYYFHEGDQVKIENVKSSDLLEIAGAISEHLRVPPRKVIFYDLDSINLAQYEKEVFKKICSRFR